MAKHCALSGPAALNAVGDQLRQLILVQGRTIDLVDLDFPPCTEGIIDLGEIIVSVRGSLMRTPVMRWRFVTGYLESSCGNADTAITPITPRMATMTV